MKELHDAFPPTPDICRDAVLHAVSTYKEEEIYMKKRHFTVLAAALMILLLCGTAYAISAFSVRDVITDPNIALDDRLVPIESTQTSNGLTVTLGDAVFDGSTMLGSLQVETAEGMQPVYVIPRLEAQADGQPLDVYGGLRDAGTPDPLDYTVWTFGSLFPSADANYPSPEKLICKGFTDEPIEQEVQWTLSLDLYTANWPMKDITSIYRDGDYEAARTLYEQGCISTVFGRIDDAWIDWLFLNEEDVGIPLPELLTREGAFTLADTLTFSFTTPVFQPQVFHDDTIHQMDGFTIEVTDLRQTFLTLEYTLLFRYDECQIPEGSTAKMAEFNIDVNYLPEGMEFRDGSIRLADDGMSATYQGKVQYISDEPLTELTFTLDPRWTNTKYDVYPSFTVKLDK